MPNQPVQMTTQELYAFNVLSGTVATSKAEFDRSVEARQAYIELLEMKYQAKFDPATGTFQPAEETGEKPDGQT